MEKDSNLRPSAQQLLNSEFLQSEIELKLRWEKNLNDMYKTQIKKYEGMLNIKRKLSI